MGPVSRFLKTASPTAKVFMGLGVAGMLFVTHKTWIGPYLRKQRYKQAEAWAEMIIEKEESELNNK